MKIRPLRDEPVGLDLVDTVWVDQGELLDQFDTAEGVAAWLADHDLPGSGSDERVRDHLVEARAAMRDALEGRGTDRLNAVLSHGSRRPQLRGAEPYELVVVDDAERHAAWVAAADLVRVLGERAERVRHCANPECVLWFVDISKNGSRRWCSMDVCGNRAKVGRFNQRQKAR
ncbi:CGNR zinc finger domain-containing protein [Nonomuraea sp. NBC_01738]|uniref:CGNR zinc finger domain-containing protein n=1 Tax=Nonomuraea sp. NBC_01738 TaxID=2976003 RepID=UPI002E1136B3|nr:CGNR zinc finger domain-containing protein [Nonomuraea sp. NBC_01738]